MTAYGQTAEYRKLESEWHETTMRAARNAATDDGAKLYEEAKKIFAAMQKVGSFKPIFLHHPKEGALGIYPTVSQDIGRVVIISRGVIDIMEEQFIPKRPPRGEYQLPPTIEL